MGQTQQAPEAHKQKAGSNTICARQSQSRATRLEGGACADQYRAEDTTRRERRRMSSMKGRGGGVRTTQQSTRQGGGRGTHRCARSRATRQEGGRGRTHGSIQGRQETQHDANASARANNRRGACEENNAAINASAVGRPNHGIGGIIIPPKNGATR
jgi:hypothetical protein